MTATLEGALMISRIEGGNEALKDAQLWSTESKRCRNNKAGLREFRFECDRFCVYS